MLSAKTARQEPRPTFAFFVIFVVKKAVTSYEPDGARLISGAKSLSYCITA
jgi:hypothetical protein